LRFKIPPPNSRIGWRVEFRSMEVQVTDFENAAFSIFVLLLSRAILKFGLNFYIPISKVDENMQRAQKRGATMNQKFYFRKNPFPPDMPSLPHTTPTESIRSSRTSTPIPTQNGDVQVQDGHHNPAYHIGETNGIHKALVFGKDGIKKHQRRNSTCSSEESVVQSRCPSPPESGPVEEEYEEMTITEIINGKDETFPGLVGVVNMYLNSLDGDFESKKKIRAYIQLVKKRADGTLINAATWIRNFIRSHPMYKQDSVVSQETNFDLMIALDELERGTRTAPEFLPQEYVGSKVDNGCL